MPHESCLLYVIEGKELERVKNRGKEIEKERDTR
jgi:hypothetical protein